MTDSNIDKFFSFSSKDRFNYAGIFKKFIYMQLHQIAEERGEVLDFIKKEFFTHNTYKSWEGKYGTAATIDPNYGKQALDYICEHHRSYLNNPSKLLSIFLETHFEDIKYYYKEKLALRKLPKKIDFNEENVRKMFFENKEEKVVGDNDNYQSNYLNGKKTNQESISLLFEKLSADDFSDLYDIFRYSKYEKTLSKKAKIKEQVDNLLPFLNTNLNIDNFKKNFQRLLFGDFELNPEYLFCNLHDALKMWANDPSKIDWVRSIMGYLPHQYLNLGELSKLALKHTDQPLRLEVEELACVEVIMSYLNDKPARFKNNIDDIPIGSGAYPLSPSKSETGIFGQELISNIYCHITDRPEENHLKNDLSEEERLKKIERYSSRLALESNHNEITMYIVGDESHQALFDAENLKRFKTYIPILEIVLISSNKDNHKPIFQVKEMLFSNLIHRCLDCMPNI